MFVPQSYRANDWARTGLVVSPLSYIGPSASAVRSQSVTAPSIVIPAGVTTWMGWSAAWPTGASSGTSASPATMGIRAWRRMERGRRTRL